MKQFVLSSFALLVAAAVVAPAASAYGDKVDIASNDATDLNGDGVIRIHEARINFLNTHDSSN
ncbi:MAG: hypothetical protein AAF152_04570 [Cyanobacteria bacterium P01_A01_bin.114]